MAQVRRTLQLTLIWHLLLLMLLLLLLLLLPDIILLLCFALPLTCRLELDCTAPALKRHCSNAAAACLHGRGSRRSKRAERCGGDHEPCGGARRLITLTWDERR